MKNRLHMRFDCEASNVAVARIAIATFAGSQFSLAEVEELKIVVSEAVSNSVLHAYPQKEGEIVLNAHLSDGQIRLEVVDFGVGIADLQKAKEPGFTTIDEHMGLGLSFMESFTDDLRLESVLGQGTRVLMTKRRCL